MSFIYTKYCITQSFTALALTSHSSYMLVYLHTSTNSSCFNAIFQWNFWPKMYYTNIFALDNTTGRINSLRNSIT